MDEDFFETGSADPADDQEQEIDLDSEQTINGSEQETQPEEEPETDPEEAELEINHNSSYDMSELAAYMEVLQCDIQQMASSLDAIRLSCSAVIFLLLFIWAERKMKNAVIKMSGGKKNARID